MKTLTASLNTRLAAYAAVGTTAALASAAATSQAAIINSGPVNITIPNTADGIYINFVTGTTSTSATSGFDFDPYSGGTAGLLFYWGGDAGSINGGVASSANGPYLVLGIGSTISAASTFSQVANGSFGETAAYQAGTTGYLGVRFTNESTGAADYGYVHLQTTAGNGFPARILDYSYDNTGAAITIAAVPEPTTTAALAAFALGAVGVRRWRKGKQSAA